MGRFLSSWRSARSTAKAAEEAAIQAQLAYSEKHYAEKMERLAHDANAACIKCKFYDKPDSKYDARACMRYPQTHDVGPLYWCGEYMEKTL